MKTRRTLRRKLFQIKITQYYTCFNGFLKCILLFWKKWLIIRRTPSETVRYSDLHSSRLSELFEIQPRARAKSEWEEAAWNRAREIIFPTSLTGDVTSGIAKDHWEGGCLSCIHLSCNSNNIFYLLSGLLDFSLSGFFRVFRLTEIAGRFQSR